MMSTRPLSLALLAMLALAGCDRKQPSAAATRAAEQSAPPADVAGAAAEDDASDATARAAIPPDFRGRWAINAADCDPARGDAKGLMVVDADQLHFYESRATISAAHRIGDTLTLMLAFTGEGQQWTVASVFQLKQDGTALARTDRDPPMAVTYARCPA